jgi:para-aminobenzoate synthetase component 1
MPMTRTFRSFPIHDFESIKQQMLHWSNQFSVCCFLDNNRYDSPLHTSECLLGAGSNASTNSVPGKALAGLGAFMESHHDWIFGHLSYDLKNEIEGLQSSLPDLIGFPDLFFFVPEIVVILDEHQVRIGTSGNDHEVIFESILHQEWILKEPGRQQVNIQQRIEKPAYLQTVQMLREHIRRGDCYEINFCQEFYLPDITIDPVEIFSKLTSLSPNPFSAYYKTGNRYLLCASPERYLRKTGRQIISQPIKGTLHRVLANTEQDRIQKEKLLSSQKDRSENVMVVDLVRNDLSRVCMEGSVQVDELFGIYSFPQVHQMISTVSGQLKKDATFTDIIRATFPMGSMTGAPKRKVMQLIEQYEKSRRGLFSGAVGYINPGGDFDFNVVIRSILYNAESRYLSFPTGSAITHYSDPEAEYAECMLKGEAMRRVLEGESEIRNKK